MMKKYFLVPSLIILFLLCFFGTTRQRQIAQGPVVGLNYGNQAPEINLMTPEGKKLALSSLRGKLVLIDFWASWCGPCRHENPAVVSAYNRFRDMKFGKADGFRIYSVSLDANPDAWRAAILKDQLKWDSHVSDLGGWNSSAAALYNINSIPTNYLINEDGIIINRDLRGEQLLQALEKLSKK